LLLDRKRVGSRRLPPPLVFLRQTEHPAKAKAKPSQGLTSESLQQERGRPLISNLVRIKLLVPRSLLLPRLGAHLKHLQRRL
jgi:hypothetical protein